MGSIVAREKKDQFIEDPEVIDGPADTHTSACECFEGWFRSCMALGVGNSTLGNESSTVGQDEYCTKHRM